MAKNPSTPKKQAQPEADSMNESFEEFDPTAATEAALPEPSPDSLGGLAENDAHFRSVMAARDEIEKTSGFVGIGGTCNFSATDHNGLTQADIEMYEIKDGAWTLAP